VGLESCKGGGWEDSTSANKLHTAFQFCQPGAVPSKRGKVPFVASAPSGHLALPLLQRGDAVWTPFVTLAPRDIHFTSPRAAYRSLFSYYQYPHHCLVRIAKLGFVSALSGRIPPVLDTLDPTPASIGLQYAFTRLPSSTSTIRWRTSPTAPSSSSPSVATHCATYCHMPFVAHS
jgi:hypothetical protein